MSKYEPPYIMIKHGMYYAYNSKGYVHNVINAELYSKEYAIKHASEGEGIKAIPVTNHITDITHISAIIVRLELMKEAIRELQKT